MSPKQAHASGQKRPGGKSKPDSGDSCGGHAKPKALTVRASKGAGSSISPLVEKGPLLRPMASFSS